MTDFIAVVLNQTHTIPEMHLYLTSSFLILSFSVWHLVPTRSSHHRCYHHSTLHFGCPRSPGACYMEVVLASPSNTHSCVHACMRMHTQLEIREWSDVWQHCRTCSVPKPTGHQIILFKAPVIISPNIYWVFTFALCCICFGRVGRTVNRLSWGLGLQ